MLPRADLNRRPAVERIRLATPRLLWLQLYALPFLAAALPLSYEASVYIVCLMSGGAVTCATPAHRRSECHFIALISALGRALSTSP